MRQYGKMRYPALFGWRYLQKMTYILWIVLDIDIKIYVGSLGKLIFRKGVYLYIGSAKRGFRSRIKRHLAKTKNIFWHIDYLTSSGYAQIKEIWINNKAKECQTAKTLIKAGYNFIDRFGCSDCGCKSHLFFIRKDIGELKNLLEKECFKNADKDYCGWFS